MLKVSSRGHYGLRLMTELGRAHGRGPLSLTDIARVEGLPLPYLEQLVVPLRKAGLVEGTRGLHGGYTLSRPPHLMTAGEILRVLEGQVRLAAASSKARSAWSTAPRSTTSRAPVRAMASASAAGCGTASRSASRPSSTRPDSLPCTSIPCPGTHS